jgi:hypothetical protein
MNNIYRDYSVTIVNNSGSTEPVLKVGAANGACRAVVHEEGETWRQCHMLN